MGLSGDAKTLDCLNRSCLVPEQYINDSLVDLSMNVFTEGLITHVS